LNDAEPAPEPTRTMSETVIADTVPERVGTVIGPYKLLEQIGVGGFGLVFVAQQEDPVRRKVALKVIKPGMDSREVVARFEAERQALALMDHPNIARVLDGGTTSSGRPYFVMELVHGIPITDYCDRQHLGPRERLELFVSVCHAVQHAHQKGIIHRDIKPSNVLVAEHDGRPNVKVIDFGVAKALYQPLTEKTIHTQFAQMIGTPLYMSPEQAEMGGLDIDTRSDIYSLGVLLYELLTGTTPIDRKRFRQAAYDEVLRIIRDEDPPRPSTRLSSLGDTATTFAGNRGLDVRRLSQVLAGDLDWLVMKAIEKDRNRRYPTAENFAEDVERYLHDEAISARPPSRIYRLRKFTRRNRGTVFTASVLALSLVVGAGVSTWQALRATRAEGAALLSAQSERLAKNNALAAGEAEKKAKEEALAREAETKAVLGFVEDRIISTARPEGQEGGLGRKVMLRTAIEAAVPYVDQGFTNQPLIEARLRRTLGRSFFLLGDSKAAVKQQEAARALYAGHRGGEHSDTLLTTLDLVRSYDDLGRLKEALKLSEETLALQKARLGPDHPDTLAGMTVLANAYESLGRTADALKLREQTLALYKSRLGAEHPETLHSMSNLANTFELVNRQADALKLRQQTLAVRKARLGAGHPDTLVSMSSLATSYAALGRYAEAAALEEQTLALRKEKLGADHPDTFTSMNNLATYYAELGRLSDSLKLREEALALQKVKYGPDHPSTLMAMNNLAISYKSADRVGDALKLLEYVLPRQQAEWGKDNRDTLNTMNNLAECYFAVGRLDDATKLHQETLNRRRATLGPEHPDTFTSMNNVANCYLVGGRYAEALNRFEENLRLFKSKLGPDHPYTLVTMMNLAECYVDLGREAEALNLREATLAIQRAKLGTAHPYTVLSMNNLADSYHAAGRNADALKLRQEAVGLYKANLGPDHSDTLACVVGLAGDLVALGRGGEALPIIDDTFQRAAGKTVDPRLMPILIELRLRHFEKLQDAGGCRRTATMWEKLKRTDADSLYRSACLHAVTAAVLRGAGKSAAEQKQADAEADLAMSSLKQAVRAGYQDTAKIRKDKDLDSLRGREDFKKLFADLDRAKGKTKPKP
jgi:eukaryotic-like serine/threonine-protein kinase